MLCKSVVVFSVGCGVKWPYAIGILHVVASMVENFWVFMPFLFISRKIHMICVSIVHVYTIGLLLMRVVWSFVVA